MKHLHPTFLNGSNLFTKLFSTALLLLCFACVKAQTGQALQFNGISNYVSLPVTISGDYTKEAWINTNSLVNFPNILTGNASTGTALFLNAGKLAAGHGPAFNQIVDPTPLVAGTWYHVAVTFNATTGVMNLYKNGALVGTSTAPAYSETLLEIGRFAAANYFSGSIDEVRIWNVVKTAVEINASLNCQLNGTEPGLVAYYNFNEGIAGGTNTGVTTLYDLHGNCPLNGTLNNFALTGATSNWIAPGGVSGSCAPQVSNISIAGNGNCIIIGDVTPTTTDNTDFGTTTVSTPVDRTFRIRNNGGAVLNISTISFSGVDAGSFIILTPPAFTVNSFDSTTFVVRFLPTTSGTKNATLNITNNDTDEGAFNFAVTGTATGVVPVTLSSFTANAEGSTAKLSWQTATEINNAGFEILRSVGNGDWEKIGFVKATNKSTGSTYSFNDLAPLKGINNYRLQQVDNDGRSVLSDVRPVNFNDAASLVSIYPNPVQDKLNLVFNDRKFLNSVIKISNASGAVIKTLKLNNSYRQIVDLGSLSKGLYFITFNDGSVQRVVKL